MPQKRGGESSNWVRAKDTLFPSLALLKTRGMSEDGANKEKRLKIEIDTKGRYQEIEAFLPSNFWSLQNLIIKIFLGVITFTIVREEQGQGKWLMMRKEGEI